MVSTTPSSGVAPLNPKQLGRLTSVLTDRRPLCSPDGRPIGQLVLWDYLAALVANLRQASISVAAVSLEGSCASHVLRPGAYADVDVAISLSPCAQPREQLLAIREVVVATLTAIDGPAGLAEKHVTGMRPTRFLISHKHTHARSLARSLFPLLSLSHGDASLPLSPSLPLCLSPSIYSIFSIFYFSPLPRSLSVFLLSSFF